MEMATNERRKEREKDRDSNAATSTAVGSNVCCSESQSIPVNL